MIGTEKEMLLFLTWKRNWWKSLNLTDYEAYKMRDKIHRNILGKERGRELLTALGCVMLRDEVHIDALWDNGQIRATTDVAVKSIMSVWGWSSIVDGIPDVNAASNLARNFRKGKMSFEKKKMILLAYGYEEVVPSITLPAIWEFPPAFCKGVNDMFEGVKNALIYNQEEV